MHVFEVVRDEPKSWDYDCIPLRAKDEFSHCDSVSEIGLFCGQCPQSVFAKDNALKNERANGKKNDNESWVLFHFLLFYKFAAVIHKKRYKQ